MARGFLGRYRRGKTPAPGTKAGVAATVPMADKDENRYAKPPSRKTKKPSLYLIKGGGRGLTLEKGRKQIRSALAASSDRVRHPAVQENPPSV